MSTEHVTTSEALIADINDRIRHHAESIVDKSDLNDELSLGELEVLLSVRAALLHRNDPQQHEVTLRQRGVVNAMNYIMQTLGYVESREYFYWKVMPYLRETS